MREFRLVRVLEWKIYRPDLVIVAVFSLNHPRAAMATGANLNSIVNELDAFHDAAKQAFLARDLDAYRDLFTVDLRYTQPNGKTITRSQLVRDVGKQLRTFKTVDSQKKRKSVVVNDDGTVTQIVSQSATYSVSVFLFFTKSWTIERQGKYTFRKTDTGWKVCNVEVLTEDVESGARTPPDEK